MRESSACVPLALMLLRKPEARATISPVPLRVTGYSQPFAAQICWFQIKISEDFLLR
jgi:hypothetical protein